MNSPIETPLGEHAQITKLAGFEYTSHFDYSISGDIIALRSLNIRNGRLDLSEVRTIPAEVSNALPRSKLRRGDVVLGYVGSKLGNLARIEEDNRFHLAPNVALIRPLKGVLSEYLLQYMQGPIYQAHLWSLASSTGQPALSMASIRQSRIWLPPLPEQQRIAEILSAWDSAIQTIEKLLTNAEAQKRALMQQLLTGKRRIKEFANRTWRSKMISQMGSIVGGGTPDTETVDFWDGGIPWATPTDITQLSTRHIAQTSRTISSSGLKSSAAKLLPAGSLLVCTRATIGEMAIAKCEIATNQGFKSLCPNAEFDTEFLYYLFLLSKKAFIRLACGSTFLELSKREFERLTFLVPERDEQVRIAKILNTASCEIEGLEKQAALLRREKNALMQQLLTGKRRVLASGDQT